MTCCEMTASDCVMLTDLNCQLVHTLFCRHMDILSMSKSLSNCLICLKLLHKKRSHHSWFSYHFLNVLLFSTCRELLCFDLQLMFAIQTVLTLILKLLVFPSVSRFFGHKIVGSRKAKQSPDGLYPDWPHLVSL